MAYEEQARIGASRRRFSLTHPGGPSYDFEAKPVDILAPQL